jgi:hypothetical protein
VNTRTLYEITERYGGNNMDVVYHSSPTQGLNVITPNKSTHGQDWVYATKSIEMTAVFLSRYGGDFTCTPGWDNKQNKAYICERYQGAFDERYKNKKGSIYVLPSTTFSSGKTSWKAEVVSLVEVIPLNEIVINDLKQYLLVLLDEGKLDIKYYPYKHPWFPQDDEDLVEKGIRWTRQFGDQTLDQIKKFHPNLLDRVNEGLRLNKYI